MELILKETIDSLGREGDIVKVKPGFGRNFLLPKGKAVAANAANRAVLEKNQAVILARLEKDQKNADKIFKKLSGVTLKFEELAGEDEKLFGSVSANDIQERLAEKKIDVDKKDIILSEPIKTLGDREVSIKVGFDLVAEISVSVVAQEADS
jgi:large subunit ribosomal protein L9